nr:hypothetical protein [Novosphingobium sp. FSW06-99]
MGLGFVGMAMTRRRRR